MEHSTSIWKTSHRIAKLIAIICTGIAVIRQVIVNEFEMINFVLVSITIALSIYLIAFFCSVIGISIYRSGSDSK